MPQPAAASCYLLSVIPQPLADISDNYRCLNYQIAVFPRIALVSVHKYISIKC